MTSMFWIIALSCVMLGVIIALVVLDRRGSKPRVTDDPAEDYETDDYLWWMIR